MSSTLHEKLHVFQRKGLWIVYDQDSRALLTLEDNIGPIVYLKTQGYTDKKIAEHTGRSENEISLVLEGLHKLLVDYRNAHNYKQSNQNLNSMMLLVSQTCNMRCEYCYADGGTYNENGQKIIEDNVAKAALDLANSLGITNIQFFGGEPLLAFNSIKKIIDYAIEREYKFKYGLITNGTCITDEIANYCAENSISVTVSLDGPENVHNLCRKFTDGSGSYERVVEGISFLNKRRVPLSVQPVYSKRYLPIASPKKILSSLLPYSKSLILGFVTPHGNSYSVDDIMSDEEVSSYFLETSEFIFESNQKGIPVITVSMYNVIQSIFSETHPQKIYICESMSTRLTVFTNGDLYPCQFLCQSENFLGNVSDVDPNVLNKRRAMILQQYSADRLDMWSKNLNDLCIANLEKKENGQYVPRYPIAYNEYYEDLLYRIATNEIDQLLGNWREYLGS